MKKVTLVFTLFLALTACKNNHPTEESNTTTVDSTANATPTSAATAAEESTLKLDVAASHLTWLGKKVGGQHNGKVALKEGSATFNGNQIVSATPIIIDMTTITNEDITDAAYKAKLIGHLKAADFFDVAKYPTAKFETTSVEGNTLVGKLTIKDKTEEVKIPVTVVNENGTAKVSGKVTIDRTKFGVMYSSKKLTDTLKDKIINDDVEIGFELTFKN